jgi:hypoxia up-regulated 1
VQVGIIQPGKGIELVLNEATKRKSSTAVGFNNQEERVYGDDSYNLLGKLPAKQFVLQKLLLGKTLSSPEVRRRPRAALAVPCSCGPARATAAAASRRRLLGAEAARVPLQVESFKSFAFPYEFVTDEDTRAAMMQGFSSNQTFRGEELVAFVLSYCKQIAEVRRAARLCRSPDDRRARARAGTRAAHRL